MKHKHYEMIVAKAANMDLVVLFKASNGYKNWIEAENDLMPSFHPNTEYFLCLPQHKEACLHWLSGGSVQDYFEGSWTSVDDFEGEDWVEADNMFMNEEFNFRIKPKKEKRLISVYGDSVEFVNPDLDYPSCVQLIEIEVEV